MDLLSTYQKIVLIQTLDLDYDVQPLLNELEVDDALKLIKRYHIDFDVVPFIGKTDSSILLEKAVKSNNVELVKQCLYCKYEYENSAILDSAIRNGNSEIVNILLDKIKVEHFYRYSDLCKLDNYVVVKYFNLYKDVLRIQFYRDVCKYSNDETFLYFYNLFRNEADCFEYVIASGKLERVKKMIHLYGKPTSFDIEYKRTYNLKMMEDSYVATACETGNLELVKYLLAKRKTNTTKSEPFIHHACKGGNLELIQYLHELGYHVNVEDNWNSYKYYYIDNYTLPIFEWLMQHEVGPLTYEFNDNGSRNYDFYRMVIQRNIKYLTILQKYCNEKEWEKVMKSVLGNWDDVFISFVDSTRYFSYCKSISSIEYLQTLGEIAEEQWTELFYNLIPDIEYKSSVLIYRKYKEHINLPQLVSKLDGKLLFLPKNVKEILTDLLL